MESWRRPCDLYEKIATLLQVDIMDYNQIPVNPYAGQELQVDASQGARMIDPSMMNPYVPQVYCSSKAFYFMLSKLMKKINLLSHTDSYKNKWYVKIPMWLDNTKLPNWHYGLANLKYLFNVQTWGWFYKLKAFITIELK